MVRYRLDHHSLNVKSLIHATCFTLFVLLAFSELAFSRTIHCTGKSSYDLSETYYTYVWFNYDSQSCRISNYVNPDMPIGSMTYTKGLNSGPDAGDASFSRVVRFNRVSFFDFKDCVFNGSNHPSYCGYMPPPHGEGVAYATTTGPNGESITLYISYSLTKKGTSVDYKEAYVTIEDAVYTSQ